uniref:UDP-N-acetylglucosamine 1-carboxyvinyltransferase n=1 Tax=Prochloron didemni P3-Solomon TaxID=910458 RepID=G0XS73_PRODI|nr:UDP-N-acetylglucosamine 1-carboxyvinyltransferase NikO-like protein [Prochloron didemni P3-Solomon]
MVVGTCEGLKGAVIDVQAYSSESTRRTGPLLSGATKTALLAAATAEGISVIKNPYRKAEVLELIEFLQRAGVAIKDEGKKLIVEGRPRLKSTEYEIGSDLIEIMTFIAYAIYLNQSLNLNITSADWVRRSLYNELALLDKMGVNFEWQRNKFQSDRLDLLGGSRLKSYQTLSIAIAILFSLSCS